MLIGCAGVALLYLLINWVLVANITPDSAKVVFAYESERATLAHVVAERLVGDVGAAIVSGAMAVALISAASAMTFVGTPRVRRDGPRRLLAQGARRQGRQAAAGVRRASEESWR